MICCIIRYSLNLKKTTIASTFVLVHGAFAGRYAWSHLTPLLEGAGHKFITMDLPGHGDDNTAPGAVSFDSYIDLVSVLINAEPGQVILVGHSMAGIVVSTVAEKIPAKISKLVYLSAYLPQNGQSLQELAFTDAESQIGPNLKFTADYAGGYLPEDIAVNVFAGDCGDDIKTLVAEKSKGKLEPLAAFQAKAAITDVNFGSVEKYYIKTTKDIGVGPALQQRMIDANGHLKKILSLDCGHSSYFARPKELAEILNAL